MKATFLVDLDTGDDTDFEGISSDIKDSLYESGFAVLNVKPWARKETKLSGMFGKIAAQLRGTQTAVPSNTNQNK